MSDGLLIIDARRNMFDPEPVLHAGVLLEQLRSLLDSARHKDVPAVFVRNNGRDDDPDQPGTPGWEIDPRVGALAGEPVVDKWESNSFAGTELKAVLARSGVDTVEVNERCQQIGG
jgi:nicotinamidase-related amidase